MLIGKKACQPICKLNTPRKRVTASSEWSGGLFRTLYAFRKEEMARTTIYQGAGPEIENSSNSQNPLIESTETTSNRQKERKSSIMEHGF